MKKKRIVVAMSGGIDSSVAACILKEQGHDVIGITLQLFDYGAKTSKTKTCCAGQDIYDAKMVASKINIPHYVLDYESKFQEKVIDNFVENYISGYTPLPCVRCNQSVKFNDLLKFTKQLNADTLATGHYVQTIGDRPNKKMLKAIDHTKDQSYFLFATTQEQLNHLIFPLGGYTKEHTRELAKKYNLHIADKKDSQDICFVPDGNYSKIILQKKPNANKQGKILHVNGYELGRHEGIIHYTIGQRKRINVNTTKALYVIKIDAENNIIYVGEEEYLESSTINLENCNWIGGDTIPKNIKVRIRSTHKEVDADLKFLADKSEAIVKLKLPEKAITPGQACVFYLNNQILGGGWIKK